MLNLVIEIIQEASPVQYIQTHEGKGEHYPCHGVDLAHADGSSFCERLEVFVLGVSPQAVQEHGPAALFRSYWEPAGVHRTGRDGGVAVDISGDGVTNSLCGVCSVCQERKLRVLLLKEKVSRDKANKAFRADGFPMTL